jgi:2-iminoacetate synthase
VPELTLVSAGEKKGDEQFEISDPRNVEEVYKAIEEQGLQPVMSDYIYV